MHWVQANKCVGTTRGLPCQATPFLILERPNLEDILTFADTALGTSTWPHDTQGN